MGRSLAIGLALAIVVLPGTVIAQTRLPAASHQLPADASTDASQPKSDQSTRPERTFRLSGWTRSSVEATSSGERATPALAVPRDDVLARQLLSVRSRYTYGRWFEAAGSVLLRLGLFQPDGLRRPDPVRGEADVDVREAYVGFFAQALDLRAGIQRVAWGEGDLFSPNDVVNARDIRDPVLTETELRHVPTLAVRADVPLGGAALQVVAEPLVEADRYDVYGPNWALVQPGAPAGYRGLLGVLTDAAGLSTDDLRDVLLVEGDRPDGWSGAQAGLRLDWRAGRFDITHYYHYGYHGTPNFQVSGAAALLETVDWTAVTPDQTAAVLAALAAGGAVGSTWERRHHVGLDVVTTTGPFVLRFDAAHQQPALFYDPAFNGWLSPATEAVFGIEYQMGELGRTLLVEGRYRHISDRPPAGGLLFAERDSAEVGILAGWTWGGFELETPVVAGLQPRSVLVRPQLAWNRSGLELRGGVVLLGGDDHAFGGWYRRNRGVYLMVRKDF